ncbi:branched-chain amino acid transport system / permease component [Clostridium homopropionicum DSM 5847]|uniref:Branched-chain amino acid transport system / permease component n=1 Tax=Clostridium homopropionicum DSM 5847 TaxID=1121318 RepID=A0A0L6Z619_9CLOT|nr:ABC transporter permease [Clostridium homopropionicum]KOA18243.1 branched-chain amino acid transport system / permease component [Clostridium homopropionicum DSM 5847]SFF70688.1 nucleoside ABC transporter membrane protein [Clostridium homopropionicum]
MNSITIFLAAAVVAGTPLLFATLGEILTEKVGNLNLGVEGMMLMGAVVGFTVGLKTASPFLAIVSAAIAGSFGALIYAFLTITLRANQVVSGLTLSIFGTGFSSLLGKGLGLIGQRTPEAVKEFFQVYPIPVLNKIPVLGKIFFTQDPFIYLGYILAVILGIYIYNTNKGLNLRAVGENPACADAASINVSLYKYINVLIGGALCGLGGGYLSLVYIPAWQENVTAGRGWIAVALVIFATWNPYKAIFGSYLFGGLGIVAFRFEALTAHVSQYLIDMLPYLVTITVLVMVSMKKNRKNASPGGLGNPYFREER